VIDVENQFRLGISAQSTISEGRNESRFVLFGNCGLLPVNVKQEMKHKAGCHPHAQPRVINPSLNEFPGHVPSHRPQKCCVCTWNHDKSANRGDHDLQNEVSCESYLLLCHLMIPFKRNSRSRVPGSQGPGVIGLTSQPLRSRPMVRRKFLEDVGCSSFSFCSVPLPLGCA
jgi:hypothetical protein